MDNPFFDHPILNSPYERPTRHWELDAQGQPTQRIIEDRRRAEFQDERPIKALLDPYNPTGSTMHVRFNTSKTLRWEPRADRCHVNWAILDSDWEAEFCRVAESHPQVRAYVKNHNLGLEVPTATARRCGNTSPITSPWSTTATATTICCI